MVDKLKALIFASKVSFFIIALVVESSATVLVDDSIIFENIKKEFVEVDGSNIYLAEFNYKQPYRILLRGQLADAKCSDEQVYRCQDYFARPMKSLPLGKGPVTIHGKRGFLSKEYKLHFFPKDFPKITKKGNSSIDKNFIFSWYPLQTSKFGRSSLMFEFSPVGEILFMRKVPQLIVDFRPHLIDGRTYYSYLTDSGVYQPNINSEGSRQILDEGFNFLKEIKGDFDNHEFNLIGMNWYMFTKYELSYNKFGAAYIKMSIVEVKDGKRVFEWSTDELDRDFFFPEYHRVSIYKNIPSIHRYHINAFQAVGGDLLISLGMEAVVLINKKTKKIKWILGGSNDQFGVRGFLAPSKLHHTPIWDEKEKSITLYDNGIETQASRILKYFLDIDKKKIVRFQIINNEIGYAAMMGNVVRSDDIYTVGMGSRERGEFDVGEFRGRSLIFSIYFETKFSGIYRVYRH